MSNQQNQNNRPVPSLDQVMNKPVEQMAEIPEGTHPAVLLRFGQPFWMAPSEQFKDKGEQLKVEVTFAVRTPDNKVDTCDLLLTLPEGFTSGGELSPRSGLFKLLKATAPEAFEDGKLKKGTTLAIVLGKKCCVVVEKNKKDFPTVKTITPPVNGLMYPTEEEIKALSAASENVPF